MAGSLGIGVLFGAACGGGGGGVPGAAFTVHAENNNRFDKSTYEATAGTMVVGFEDDGSLAHTLLIEGVPGFKLAVGANQKTTSGSVTLAAGTYSLYCDIPGHLQDGMIAQLIVR